MRLKVATNSDTVSNVINNFDKNFKSFVGASTEAKDITTGLPMLKNVLGKALVVQSVASDINYLTDPNANGGSA